MEQAGYTVIGEATNGQEAYDKYVELQPDIVTMDITMPVLDGIGGLKKIKEAYPESKMVEAVQSGADEFIPKPFDGEQLVQTLAKVLEA